VRQNAKENGQICSSTAVQGCGLDGIRPNRAERRVCLAGRPKKRKYHAGSGFIWGIPD
jgi:hypothetical protein